MEALSGISGYNGLPSVVGLDGSLSDVAGKKKYPFELEKAMHNVMFIQNHMRRQDEFDAVSFTSLKFFIKIFLYLLMQMSFQEDQDWGFVAMVLDRLFLCIFTIASIVGTFAILCEAPALYDDTKPIDIDLSLIVRNQYLPDVDNS